VAAAISSKGSCVRRTTSCVNHDAAAASERLATGVAFSVRSGGLSPAARRAVQKQQRQQHRDQAAFQEEIEKKHLDD
jgi:hypothetical protein